MLLQYFIAKYFSAYINGVISKKAIPTNAITINSRSSKTNRTQWDQ